MAAIVVTASAVSYVSGPKDDGQTAGEAFAAGAAVYLSAVNGKWYKAQADGAGADSGTAAEAAGSNGSGIALFTADAANARGSIARPGAIVNMNAVLTAGTTYYIHGTAGSFGVFSELASTNKCTPILAAITTSQFKILEGYNGAVLA